MECERGRWSRTCSEILQKEDVSVTVVSVIARPFPRMVVVRTTPGLCDVAVILHERTFKAVHWLAFVPFMNFFHVILVVTANLMNQDVPQ